MDLEFDHFYSVKNDFDNALQAVTLNLNPKLVLYAYPKGMFPWIHQEEMFFWFSPDPRMVLFPEKIKVSKSMRNILNRNIYKCTVNVAFEQVIRECARSPRKNQDNTWIDNDFIDTYSELHKMGYAQSVEVWKEGKLVGGLYGLSIGKVFFGESMFSKSDNASKTAFIFWARELQSRDFKLIDCQDYSTHLASLGAEQIEKEEFLEILKLNC